MIHRSPVVRILLSCAALCAQGAAARANHCVFLQGEAAISQTLEGFAPDRVYQLRFQANGRAATPPPQLQVRLGEQVVLGPVTIPAVDEYERHTSPWPIYIVEIRPRTRSPVLEFRQTLAGDRTVLIDNISIAPREGPGTASINARNLDFEADGPGIVGLGQIAAGNPLTGWNSSLPTHTGRNARGGPFFDNGIIAEGPTIVMNKGIRATAAWDRVLPRVGREETILLQLIDEAEVMPPTRVRMHLPPGVETRGPLEQTARDWNRRTIYTNRVRNYFQYRKQPELFPAVTLAWTVFAAAVPVDAEGLAPRIRFTIEPEELDPIETELETRFAPPYTGPTDLGYVPPPIVPERREPYIVGVMRYPGWTPGESSGWSLLEPYPERKPALGYYDDNDPEVADWEIKWAVEHGIQFFNYCWYRRHSRPGEPPVVPWLGGALHNGLLNARYIDHIRFTIMYENKGMNVPTSPDDMLMNLVPFWIENYFTHPSYLKVDGKPVLFIYEPMHFVESLGGPDAARTVLSDMRDACMLAGFDGAWILAEDRNMNADALRYCADLGFDATFAYCHGYPEPIRDQAVVERILDRFTTMRERSGLTILPTWSCMWDPAPWIDYIDYPWHHIPFDMDLAHFRMLGEKLRIEMDRLPPDDLGRRLIQIDNWDEYGEGHFVAPTRLRGFGYLDAIREVFCEPAPHQDVTPEDVGLGPYDQRYHEWIMKLQTQLDD